MPKYIKRTLSAERRARNYKQRPARSSHTFTDPFPEIHGTLPEKMVYAELSRRGIPFLFLNDITYEIPDLEFMKVYQTDFVIPDSKIIIEVQGAYWHSMEKTIEADAFKFAVYQTTGWKPLAWWDYDIESRLQDLFAETPELAPRFYNYGGAKSLELPVQARTLVDSSKGIRTLNARRKRGKMATAPRRTLRKATGFYAT